MCVVNEQDYTFNSNNLTSATVPTGVKNMYTAAFNNNLLPDDQAFIYARNTDGSINNTYIVSYGCSRRNNVVIPSSIITIGSWVLVVAH